MLAVFAFAATQATAQEADKKGKAVVEFETSAECGMCKKKIEEALVFEKGVKSATLDVKSQVLTVEYKANKTTPETICKAVAELGYDCGEVEANPSAYEELPECCKKGAHAHERE